MDPTYKSSPIHRLPTGLKLLILLITSVVLFFFSLLPLMFTALFVTWLLFVLSNFKWSLPILLIKPLLWLLIALFAFQSLADGLYLAMLIVIRVVVLLLLAALVTLTTPVSRMMETFEGLFSFLRYFHINPAKIALALSLTIRFIPVCSQIINEVREAQKARGLENNLLALAIPSVTRMIKAQLEVAAAIEARCYDFSNLEKEKK